MGRFAPYVKTVANVWNETTTNRIRDVCEYEMQTFQIFPALKLVTSYIPDG